MKSELCPCGSKKTYEECCKPIILGTKNAETPEELMRARYSSYVKSEIDFTRDSMHSSVRDTFEKDKSEEWSTNSEWSKLEILDTKDIDEMTGSVEFKAFYKYENKDIEHHELSIFKKEQKKWYFYEGKILIDPIVNQEPKIGRNDPCPCGSGKKYKKCCGKL